MKKKQIIRKKQVLCKYFKILYSINEVEHVVKIILPFSGQLNFRTCLHKKIEICQFWSLWNTLEQSKSKNNCLIR